jgi:hypothetical protein
MKKRYFADYFMEFQYQELKKIYGHKKAIEMIKKTHKEYYGKSAKFYGIE